MDFLLFEGDRLLFFFYFPFLNVLLPNDGHEQKRKKHGASFAFRLTQLVCWEPSEWRRLRKGKDERDDDDVDET